MLSSLFSPTLISLVKLSWNSTAVFDTVTKYSMWCITIDIISNSSGILVVCWL